MRKPGTIEPVILAHKEELLAILWGNTAVVGDCRVWLGSRDEFGYGRIFIPNSGLRDSIHLHKVSYVLFNGSIPVGQLVMHSCDYPACWYPKHLLAGTHADNTRDMMEKGRHVKAPVGRSGIRYVIWSTKRRGHAQGWKFYKNDSRFLHTPYIESPVFKTVEEAHAWGEVRGHYA